MSAPIMIQTKALTKRYLVTLYRSPVKSITRILIWPGFLIGLCLYLLINASGEEFMKRASLEIFVPNITLLLTAFPVYHFAEWLVTDKASGMKSLMISMGLKRKSYYLGNSVCFVAFVLPILVAVAAISVIYVFKESKSSLFAIFLLFILFVAHLIGFIFTITSFITSTGYVAIVFVLIVLETQFHSLIIWLMRNCSESMQPFVLFMGSISPYESIRILCSGYTLCRNCDTTQLSVGNELVNQPVYLILIAMTVWTLAAFAFARWFEEVCPWQKDTAIKSPLFCLKSATHYPDLIEMDDESVRGSKYFERNMTNREVGIHVNKVTKQFRGVPVVNDLTFNIYKGETTLLLGHNGAGKTTLMNIILGKLSAEKGRVRIKQADEHEGLGVGVCPQTSILDENLNVRQHLELFAGIKSSQMSAAERESHIKTTIDDVSLNGHANKVPSELSGGMKRKLNLAMAFVGNSSILILDEPSSGLDPDSRVFVWNAIRRYRADRTVLLSTQHMEEADYLGDRIAIMSAGKIICCGSSTFLNNIFGTGYKIRIQCHASRKKKILEFIKKYFPTAKLSEHDQIVSPILTTPEEDSVQDMVVELTGDRTDDYEGQLISLLTEIEERSKELHIISHGLKSSSIEDVMLNTSKSFAIDSHESVKLSLTSISGHVETLANPLRAPNSSSFAIQKSLFLALIIKHIQTYKRDWQLIVLYRFIVAIFGVWSLIHYLNEIALVPTYSISVLNTFMVFHFVYHPTLERASKFKTMQLTSNLNFVNYWISQLVIDLISIVVLIISVNIFLKTTFNEIYQVSEFSIHFIVSTSIALLGISGAFLAYILSTMLTDAKNSIGYNILFYNSHLFIACIIYILRLISRSDLNVLHITVRYLFVCLLPTAAIENIFYGLGSKCYVRSRLIETCEEQTGFSPVTFGMMALCGQVLVYGSALYWIERLNIDLSWYCNYRNICCRKRQVLSGEQREIDKDVVEESTKAMRLVNNVPKDTYSLVAADLNKSYVKGVKVIDHLSLTVNRGECFGLLGVNGAGKSTTFSMLIAESSLDQGRIWMNGYYSHENIDNYRNQVGYDPQTNPEMSLSPYEALYLMARLRSVDERSIPSLVNSILELLEMDQHATKSAKNLSGGTKRKLALGMGLIGNPSVLALDEPTAGVDPMARRGIWQLLRALRTRNRASIIISSHAMEECEAICDRISIMACGRLRCIGTFLHLRSKFSQGCSVKVQFGLKDDRLSESFKSTERIISELRDIFETRIGSSVSLTDTNANSATFNVSDDRVSRAAIFMILRKFKQKYPNMRYMVNDSSLEDIFIALAREQQQLHE